MEPRNRDEHDRREDLPQPVATNSYPSEAAGCGSLSAAPRADVGTAPDLGNLYEQRRLELARAIARGLR